MAVYAVVQFESIVLQERRIHGAADDYVQTVVNLAVQHPDGRWCSGCIATIRHEFRSANGGAVEVSIDATPECAPYVSRLERFVADYYREHTAMDGTEMVMGADPLLLGVRRAMPDTTMVRIDG